MKKCFYCLTLATTILLTSCNRNHREKIMISDFSKSQKIEISFETLSGTHVDRVYISVKGEVNDTTKLGRYLILPLKVDTIFSHEWYGSDYVLNFQPHKADVGKLNVDIEFVVY